MTTRRNFLLSGVALGTGITLAEGRDSALAAPTDFGWRFGRTESPRCSISVPNSWFLVERLTDVIDPIQLFSLSSRPIPVHRNWQGGVNPAFIPGDGIVLSAYAFRITPDMAVYDQRTSAPPPTLRLQDLQGGEPFGNLGFNAYGWAFAGIVWGIQLSLWVGDGAPPVDLAAGDAALATLTFDEAL